MNQIIKPEQHFIVACTLLYFSTPRVQCSVSTINLALFFVAFGHLKPERDLTNNNDNDNETIMVIKVDALKAAKKELHRRRHNNANARYRANQSQVEREASRKRDRERHRQRRALMSEERTQQLRAKDRVYQARKREAAAATESILTPPPAPKNPITDYIDLYHHWHSDRISTVGIPQVVSAPPDKLPSMAFQCTNCKLMFWDKISAQGHEYEIIGDLAKQEGAASKLFWFKLPCAVKDPSNIPDAGSPVYLPSTYQLQRFLKKHEYFHFYHPLGMERMKECIKAYEVYGRNPKKNDMELLNSCKNDTTEQNLGWRTVL